MATRSEDVLPNGKATRRDEPTLRLTFDSKPSGVDPDGTLHTDWTLTGLEVAKPGDASEEALRSGAQQMRALIGTHGKLAVTSRGLTKQFTVELAPSAPPRGDRMFETLASGVASLPLPEQAIGKGARWQVKQTIRVGAVLTETSVYTLRSVTKQGAELDVAVTQSAGNQLIEDGTPDGPEVRLASMQATGQGQVHLDFARWLPASKLSLDVKSESEIRMDQERLAHFSSTSHVVTTTSAKR